MKDKNRTQLYRWRGGLILGVSLILSYFSTAQPLMRSFQGAIYVGYSRNFIVVTTIGVCLGLAVILFGTRLPKDFLKQPKKFEAVMPLLVLAIGVLFIGFGVSVIIRGILISQGYQYL